MRIVRPLILLLFFSLPITCGHNTPPPSPPPVPPPCSNCPPPQTQPTPPPPVVTCKVKSDAPLLLFGYYGISSGAGLDIPKFAETLCKAGYVGVDVHGLGTIWQTGVFPWPLKNGKYDLSKDNTEYWEALSSLAGELKKRNMVLYWCYFDQYFGQKYAQYQHHPHPFRSNTLGFNWGSDVRLLYNNYSWATHQNTWLIIPDESKPETFAPTSAGIPIVRYIDKVNAIFASTGVRTMARLFNEETCQIDSSGHCTNSSSAGDVSFLDDYMEYKLRQAGVKHFVVMNDFTPFTGAAIDWKNMKQAALYTVSKGRQQELHHCNSTLLQQFVTQTGIKGTRVFCSSDGLREDDTYYLAAQSIAADVKLGNSKAGDVKFYAGTGAHWSETDIQGNMDKYFAPLQEKLGNHEAWIIHGESPLDQIAFMGAE